MIKHFNKLVNNLNKRIGYNYYDSKDEFDFFNNILKEIKHNNNNDIKVSNILIHEQTIYTNKINKYGCNQSKLLEIELQILETNDLNCITRLKFQKIKPEEINNKFLKD